MDEIHRFDSFPHPCHVYLYRRFHDPPCGYLQKGSFKGALPFRADLLFSRAATIVGRLHLIFIDETY